MATTSIPKPFYTTKINSFLFKAKNVYLNATSGKNKFNLSVPIVVERHENWV